MYTYYQKLHDSVDKLCNDVSVFKRSINKFIIDKLAKIKEYDKLEGQKNNLSEEIKFLRTTTQIPNNELNKGGVNAPLINIKAIQSLNDAEAKLTKADTILSKIS